MASNHHVELTPADSGFQDRYVVQEVIKEMARNRPLDGGGAMEGGGGGGGRRFKGERPCRYRDASLRRGRAEQVAQSHSLDVATAAVEAAAAAGAPKGGGFIPFHFRGASRMQEDSPPSVLLLRGDHPLCREVLHRSSAPLLPHDSLVCSSPPLPVSPFSPGPR